MEEDDIAIVGAGCRFPGADNLDEFWRVLVNGENHVRDIPESRWNNTAFYDEDPNVPGKTYVTKAGLLSNHDKWDNRLFGISEVESSRIDPQQRYVLECVHMAMEDGGFTRKQISGSKTGVIIGCMNDDYSAMANYDLADVGGYNATGTSTSVISARVSYVYNLHGTCLTLDTACSSALIAIHLASQAIRTGDCDMMICGGVNSILSPDIYIALCKARMMSATGQCFSFCDTADGYARGEGCGIVILKGLKAARRDGNKIWATIKTGSNQDGSMAKPMTAPSGDQQMKLLKRVYDRYQFDPSDIQYIEAHGTGTPRGDPTELNTLGKFFSSARDKQSDHLLVGSVKSNIGHTESAAGVAGLMKVLLMMHNGKYVPSLHVKADQSNVNSKIKLSEYRLDIPTSVSEWPTNKNGQRHACLNSFGFGGSNTHAIITLCKSIETTESPEQDTKLPICISGVDQEALRLNLSQFHDDLYRTDVPLHDVAVTSWKNRDIFTYRTLVYGNDRKTIQKECTVKAKRVSELSPKKEHNIVFVYCGVGTTWKGMCRELMQHVKVFRDTIGAIDQYLKPLTNWKIADKFLSEAAYDDPFLNHIAIFCVQVALTEVWKSFGIVPDKIIGQSVGEVAAAYAAKCLSLEEAVNIIYYRSLILAQQSKGSMSVVGNIDIHIVEELCSRYGDKVCIAVYSSPTACTISGAKEEVNMITEILKNKSSNKDVFVRELNVKCAYHSPMLEGCMDEIITKIDGALVGIQAETVGSFVPMLSTVSCLPVTRDELRTGQYWATNIRRPVRFMQSIKAAFVEDKNNVYLEIGPRPVLKAHIGHIFEKKDTIDLFPSMLVNKEMQSLYGSVSGLFEAGVDIQLPDVSANKHTLTGIPRYVFNKTGELFIPNKCKAYLSGAKHGSASHLYVQTSKSATETLFRIVIDEESTPFVFEHFLSEKIIVPGATYVEAGFHIGQELLQKPTHMFSVCLRFEKTFTPTVGRQSELQVKINLENEKECLKFNVENNSSVLANGTVKLRTKNVMTNIDIDYISTICSNFRSKQQCYDALKQFNFRYGESLSLIKEAWISDAGKQCLVEIILPETMNKDLIRTHFHPAAIDATFQIFGIIVRESLKDAFAVPKGVDSVAIKRPLEDCMFGYAEEIRRTSNSIHFNAILMSKNGMIIAEIENFYTRLITKETIEDRPLEYAQKWTEHEAFSKSHRRPRSIVLISNNPETNWIQKLKCEVDVIEQRELDDDLLAKDSGDITYVVYHVSGRNCKKPDSHVLEEATKRFSDVQNILISSQNSDRNIQLAVVTENTQACAGRDQYNYEGSELWGLIRSAMHEGFYDRVRLIDIDPDKMDVPMLLSALSTESHEDLAMSGQTVYQVRLTSELNFENVSRPISVKPSDILSVHSMSSNYVKDPYLLIAENKKCTNGTVSIDVHSFVCHNKSLYIPVVGDRMKSEQLLQNDHEDNRVVMIEGKGKDRATRRDVFFLHPVKAGTTVNIPNEHVFDANDFGVYNEGCLILMNLLAHVASAIESGKDVAVLTDIEDEDFGAHCLRHLMKEKQCNVQFYTLKNIRMNESIHQENSLVLATISSVEYWKLIVKSFPHLQNVITLSSFIPDVIHLWVKHNFMDIDLKVILTSDVLDGKKISEALPSIKKCIQGGCLENTLKDNRFILKLPMQTLELRRNIEDETMRCYCSPRHLFRSDSCYVVIGGLTGLGWELLQMIAGMGAKTLITMSRRTPNEETCKAINKVRDDLGCRIVPMQVDICDIESVKQVFGVIDKEFPNCPIRGIFQGAGVVSDSILQNLDKEKVTKVMRPKVQGTWNLHVASLNLPLDYFVIHSSIVSVLGNPGQCNYAAANSFLDSFALHRRSLGLPAQSINWDALEIGMATESDILKENLRQKGFNLVTKEKVRESFMKAIESDSTNIVFADIEWPKLLSISTFAVQATVKFIEFHTRLIGSKERDIKQKTRLEHDEFRKLNDDQKEARVKSLLREIIHLVFVIDTESLNDSTRLTDIGIDSMAAMSLSNAIDETFGYREAVVTLLSEETTLSTISRDIIQNYVGTEMIDKKTTYNNSDNLSEFRHIFASRDMTFMQKDILEKCAKKIHNPNLLSVIDIEVFGHKHPISVWKTIITHTLKLNQEFGKRYFFSEQDEISVQTLNVEETHLSITNISVQDFEESQQYDIRPKIDFDLHGSLPIRFQIGNSSNKTMVRLILHKVAFDMKGLTMFCNDLETTAESFIKDGELPPLRPYVDIPSAVEEAIFPRMNQLKSYWNNYLDCDIKPITFGDSLQDVDGDFCHVDHLDLPSSVVSNIKKYIGKKGISLYEFIISMYQLYLYIGSGSRLITIGTAADMRFHVPVLNNILTRCVNYIPIVTDVQEGETVEEFIKRNSTQLSATTRNGAYPGSLILQNIKSKEMQRQVFRHTLSMNDMSGMQGAAHKNTASVYQIRRILHSRPTRETFMYVKYDLKREWIKLELGHNSRICGHIGKYFSTIIMSIAGQALNDSELAVKKLKDFFIEDEKKTLKEEVETEGVIYAEMHKLMEKTSEERPLKKTIKGNTNAPINQNFINILHDDTNKTVKILNNGRAESANKDNIMGMNFMKETNRITNEPKTGILHKSKDVLITGTFRKQTSHGWDHKVDVKLIRDGDKHVVLEWGKDRRIRKKTNKTFDLNSVNRIIMRKMNDMQSIIILSKEQRIVLKTPDRKQAEQWMIELQKAFVLS